MWENFYEYVIYYIRTVPVSMYPVIDKNEYVFSTDEFTTVL